MTNQFPPINSSFNNPSNSQDSLYKFSTQYEKGIRDRGESGFYNYGMDQTLRNASYFSYAFNKDRKQDDNYDPYITAGIGNERDEEERLNYLRNSSTDPSIDPRLELEELARKNLAERAFTAFNSEIYNITLSGTKALGRIMGAFSVYGEVDPTLSPQEQDRRKRNYDKYTASVVYQHLFNYGNYAYGTNRIYAGLGIDYNRSPSDPVDTIDEARALIRTIIKGEEFNVEDNVRRVHKELISVYPDLLASSKYGKSEPTNEMISSISKKIVDETDYVSKPGIRQAVALIESSNTSLTIDLFQLQNKTVSDVLISKLEREKKRIASGEFKVNIRLSAPSNTGRANLIGYQILGPNIVVMERLMRVRDDIAKNITDQSQRDNLMSSGFKLEFMDSGSYHAKVFTSDRVAQLGSFNWTSPVGNSVHQSGSNYEEIHAFHNRLEELGVYDSLNKKGSIPTNTDIHQFMNTEQGMIQALKELGTKAYTSLNSDEEQASYTSSRLYLQTRLLNQRGLYRTEAGQAFTKSNVGLAGDIGQSLRTTVQYLTNNRGGPDRVNELYMNLNQVWLLQLDNSLYYGSGGDYKGEMGPMDNNNDLSNLDTKHALDPRRAIYRQQQRDLFQLILEGRAHVSVDPRNYREKIIHPMEEKVKLLLGRIEAQKQIVSTGTGNINLLTDEQLVKLGTRVYYQEYNGSISNLTNRVGNSEEGLTKLLGLDVGGVNRGLTLSRLGINPSKISNDVISQDASLTSRQLLAIGSGNIIVTTETMSHVKNFVAVSRERGKGYDNNTNPVIPISYYSGSSNLGYESTAFSTTDKGVVSTEAGLILMGKEVRFYGQSKGFLENRNLLEALSDEEEQDELQRRFVYPMREWERLTQTSMLGGDPTQTGSTGIWESKVSAWGLHQMKERVEQMNKSLGYSSGQGIKLTPIHGSKGDITSYMLSFSTSSMGGGGYGDIGVGYQEFKYRFTVLKDLSGKPGMVYMIDQNKVIGNSLLFNKTGMDIGGLPFGMDSNQHDPTKTSKLGDRESLRLSPTDTFISLMATMSGEVANRTLIHEPMSYLSALKGVKTTGIGSNSPSMLGKAGLDYLKFLGTGSGTADTNNDYIKFFESLDFGTAHVISQKFGYRHVYGTTQTGKRALQLSSGEYTPYDGRTTGNDKNMEGRVDIMKNVVTIATINEQIKTLRTQANTGLLPASSVSKLNQLERQRDAILTHMMYTFDELINTEDRNLYQADIGLGIVESRRDPFYYQKRNTTLKEVKAGLIEPFITIGQASFYGASQAWFRNPLYEITSRHGEFLSKGEQGMRDTEGSLQHIFKYAMAQPYIYGPTDTVGTNIPGVIRSVADGGGAGETIEQGYSLFGRPKGNVGDVMDMEIITYAGVGTITTRTDLERRIGNLLYEEYSARQININRSTPMSQDEFMNALRASTSPTPSSSRDPDILSASKKFIELINTTPLAHKNSKGENYVDEFLTFTFNTPGKLSQVPQRLKNVAGSKPMYEMDSAFTYLLRSRGRSSSSYNTDYQTLRSIIYETHSIDDRYLFGDTPNARTELTADQYLEGIHRFRKAQLMEVLVDKYTNNDLGKAYIYKTAIEDIKKNALINSPTQMNLELERILSTTPGISEDSKNDAINKLTLMYKEASEAMGPDSKLALINSGGIRIGLTQHQHEMMESFKSELKSKYGFRDEEFSDESHIARYMLLSALRSNDMLAAGIKGFTGGATKPKGDSSFILVQTSGAYSDYAYTNPLHGTDINFLNQVRNKLGLSNNETFIPGRGNISLTNWDALSDEDKDKLGMMTGFTEKAEKRQKSSMLVEDWISNGSMIARSGDIVTYDNETNRVLVWGSRTSIKEGQIPKTKIDMSKLSNADKENLRIAALGGNISKVNKSTINSNYYLREEVDSRDQVSAISSVIDNFRTIDDLPNVSLLERQTWYRNAEQSVEYLLSAKQLTGIAENTQLLWEFIYNRSIVMGGGRRVEGMGMLAKAVSIMADPSFFEIILSQMTHTSGAFANVTTDLHNVAGLYNPSNLKSYIASHGQEIVRNERYVRNLISSLNGGFNLNSANNSSKDPGGVLTSAILMAFGDSFIKNKDTKSSIYNELFQKAINNQMGGWMRNIAITSALTGSNSKLMGKLDDLSTSMGGRLSHSELISAIIDPSHPRAGNISNTQRNDILGLLGQTFGSELTKTLSKMVNATQVPINKVIDEDIFLRAVKGDTSSIKYLNTIIEKYINPDSVKGRRRDVPGVTGKIADYIISNNLEERNAALAAGNLDIIMQLMGQRDLITIPTDINLNDNRTLLTLLAITGHSELGEITSKIQRLENTTSSQEKEEIEKELNVVRSLLRGMTLSSNVLKLKADFIASQSKEPVGSKHTGGLEFQHMVKSLHQNADQFGKTGSLADLRKVIANMFAAVSHTESMTTMDAIMRNSKWMVDRPVYDISDVQSISVIHAHKFIGLYQGMSIEDQNLLKQVKRDFKDYGRVVETITDHIMKELGNITGNTLEDRAKRVALTGEIQDLLTLMPEVESSESSLFQSKVKYFVEDDTRYDKLGIRESSEAHRLRGIIDKYTSSIGSIKSDKGKEIDINTLLGRVSSLQTVLTGRGYQLDPNKAFGMGSVQPLLEGLDYKSFMFSLPSFFVEGQTEEGGIKLRFDFSKESSQYSYLLSATELKALGDQYGSYVDELVAKTLMLASAFTPGTEMSNIRNLIQRTKMSGDSSIELSKEEYTSITKFYETAVGEKGILSLMAESGANVRSQQAAAGKVRMRGIVTIPAASFLISPGSILLAEEGERRQIQMSYDRYQAYLGAQGEYNRIINTPRTGNPLEDSRRRQLSNYYKAMQSAALYGISEEGTRAHQDLLDKYKVLKEKISRPGIELGELTSIERELNILRKISNVSQTGDNKGNLYVKRLGEVLESELQSSINQRRNAYYNTSGLISDPSYNQLQALTTLYYKTPQGDTPQDVSKYRLDVLNKLLVSRVPGIDALGQSPNALSQLGITLNIDASNIYKTGIQEIDRWSMKNPTLRNSNTTINKLLTEEQGRVAGGNDINNDSLTNLIEALKIVSTVDKEGFKIVQKLFYRVSPELNRVVDLVNTNTAMSVYPMPRLLAKGTGDISLLSHLDSYNLMDSEMEGKLRKRIDPFSSENIIGSETDKAGLLKHLVDSIKTQFEQGVLEEVKSRSTNTFDIPDEQYKSMVSKSLSDISGLVDGLTIVSKLLGSTRPNSDTYKVTEADIDNLANSLSRVKGLPQGSEKIDRTGVIKLLGIEEASLISSRAIKGGNVVAPGHANIRISQVQTLVDTLMNSLDSSDVTQVLGFRSPPPGGTEAQRYTLQVLSDISLVNDYSAVANGDMGLKYDSTIGRNKSLTLVSPVSLLTMSLGDFDGDPYTTVYSNFMDHHRNLYKNETRLSFLKDVKLKDAETQLRKQRAIPGVNLNNIDLAGAEALLSSDPTLESKNPDLYKAIQSYISINRQITQVENDSAMTRNKISVMNSQLEKSSYNRAVKKEVSNYVGISGKYFTSSSEGGYRDIDTSTSIALTMIEQGAGLFGGIRNKAPAVEATKNLLTNMMSDKTNANHLDTKFLQELIRAGSPGSGTDIDTLANTFRLKIQDRVDDRSNPFRSSYVGLLMTGDDGIKTFIRDLQKDAKTSIESINRKYGTDNTEDYFLSGNINQEDEQGIGNELLASIAGRMISKQASLGAAQNIFLQGAGVSLDRGSYDMLTYTMGKAGGDILGKTYNTFIGVIYRDSPIVALGHVMQDENLNSALRDHFNNNAGSVNGMTYDDFMSAMNTRVAKAESLQGYIKNINQLLRDGIKPKISGGGDLLSKLKDWSEEYEVYERQGMHAEQSELITKIAGSFGPSGSDIGMNAFIQLSSLVTHRENLMGAGNIASTSIKVSDIPGGGITIGMNPIAGFDSSDPSKHNIGHILGSLFGITTQSTGEINQIEVPDTSKRDSLDTFTKIITQLHEQKGGGDVELNAFDVAAFKTARDLQGVIVAYQYANLTGTGFDERGKNITSMNEMLRSSAGRYAIEKGLYDPASSTNSHTDIVNQLLGGGYTSGGTRHDIQTLNEWVSTSISSSSTYMHLLSSFTGKSEETLRKDYLGFNPDGTFRGDSRLGEKASMFAIMEHTLEVTEGLYGKAGEGLYDFTRYEKERKRLMSVLGGGASTNDTEGTGTNADLWHTVMNLMAGDKLSPHAANVAFRTIIEAQSAASSSRERMIEMLTGINPDGSASYRVGTNPVPGTEQEEAQYRTTLKALLEDKSQRAVGGAMMGDGSNQGWFFEYVNKMLESSTTNIRNEALGQFFEAATGQKDAIWGDPNSLIDNIVDKSTISEDELSRIRGSLNQGISDLRELTIQRLQGERAVVTNKRSQRVDSDIMMSYHSRSLQSAQQNASNVNTVMDFLAPTLLTVLGAGIMSGNIEEEAIGQAVGGTVMALGYMRSGRVLESVSLPSPGLPDSPLSRTTRSITRTVMGGLVSSSFKLNTTLQETQGNLGQAVALSIGREVGFAIGSSLIAPTIERTVMALSTRHLERTNKMLMEYEVTRLNRGQKLDYMLKGLGSALDPDDFAGTKGTLSTVGGALLSGFMGLLMGNIGSNMAASAYIDNSDRRLSEFALVEQGLNTLYDMQMEASRRSAERESNPDIYDEFGYGVDVYEASPFEEYYMRAISDATIPIEQLLESENQTNMMVFPDVNV